MTKRPRNRGEMVSESNIRELEGFRDMPIRTADDARAKLAAKYWAQIGRLMNEIQQQPTKKTIDEARDLLERFGEIPDKPFDLGKQIDGIETYLIAVESRI